MNDQDKEHMRIMFAGFAMIGLISRANAWEFREAWEIADGMIEAREPKEEIGIKTVRKGKK